jgi:hypothetical protein
MDKYITGKEVVREYEITRPSMFVEPVELTEEEIANAKRPVMPVVPANERINDFREVDLGLTEEMAILEARRCLRCELGTRDAKLYLAKQKEEATSNA